MAIFDLFVENTLISPSFRSVNSRSLTTQIAILNHKSQLARSKTIMIKKLKRRRSQTSRATMLQFFMHETIDQLVVTKNLRLF